MNNEYKLVPDAWQFLSDGKWHNGDDRIKDHRKNTEEAGYHTRDLYAAAQPADQQGEGKYPPCDYCGIVPDYHPWHGSGMLRGMENRHIHACHACRALLPAHDDQPAMAKVVLPERLSIERKANNVNFNQGWNACLYEVAKLNGVQS